MARPVKWSRDLHIIRERAARSRTETWSRVDIETLFGVGRATAQALMKAIGEIQPVGGAHFVERASLLSFLNAMVAAPSVEEGLRGRMLDAGPAPKSGPLQVSLPSDLRIAKIPDLPLNITLTPGRLEITAPTAVSMLESLVALAMVMQNDLERFRTIIEPPAQTLVEDQELRSAIARMRQVRCDQV
ncbi:MAG: hypothetical protein ACRYFU_03625 [Janthinobacterium lividum]